MNLISMPGRQAAVTDMPAARPDAPKRTPQGRVCFSSAGHGWLPSGGFVGEDYVRNRIRFMTNVGLPFINSANLIDPTSIDFL
ncbi:hypothetical protein [Trinickia fusca]|uniref:hypothetical protein n=1 Tax=Trinickia fusca TaxID=2419777 RepID=UPI0011C43245|nr:hypothetical protein [Trinickia fusca]